MPYSTTDAPGFPSNTVTSRSTDYKTYTSTSTSCTKTWHYGYSTGLQLKRSYIPWGDLEINIEPPPEPLEPPEPPSKFQRIMENAKRIEENLA